MVNRSSVYRSSSSLPDHSSTLIPALSRVQHVGVEDGINSFKWDAETHERDIASHCFSPGYEPGLAYHEVG